MNRKLSIQVLTREFTRLLVGQNLPTSKKTIPTDQIMVELAFPAGFLESFSLDMLSSRYLAPAAANLARAIGKRAVMDIPLEIPLGAIATWESFAGIGVLGLLAQPYPEMENMVSLRFDVLVDGADV